MNQSINQSNNQSINQSNNQSINQSISQSINRQIDRFDGRINPSDQSINRSPWLTGFCWRSLWCSATLWWCEFCSSLAIALDIARGSPLGTIWLSMAICAASNRPACNIFAGRALCCCCSGSCWPRDCAGGVDWMADGRDCWDSFCDCCCAACTCCGTGIMYMPGPEEVLMTMPGGSWCRPPELLTMTGTDAEPGKPKPCCCCCEGCEGCEFWRWSMACCGCGGPPIWGWEIFCCEAVREFSPALDWCICCGLGCMPGKNKNNKKYCTVHSENKNIKQCGKTMNTKWREILRRLQILICSKLTKYYLFHISIKNFLFLFFFYFSETLIKFL